MQHYFWSLAGRTAWPTPHQDRVFLARAVMVVGEKRFGPSWVGRSGAPEGAQWHWVRDYIVSRSGAGSLPTFVLSPTLNEFHAVDVNAWRDKKKIRSIFSRCQFIWPEAHPAYWNKSPAYADIYVDSSSLETALDAIETVPVPLTNIDLEGVHISTYLDVMLQVARDCLPEGKPPPTAGALAVEIAKKLYPVLNPGEEYDKRKGLEEHTRKNGFSAQMCKNMASIMRGPERINEKGRLRKDATRRP